MKHEAKTKESNFIGRTEELKKLESLLSIKKSSMVVIKGRRRIGKSRLVREFAKDKRFYRFSGIAPTKSTTAQLEKINFAKQLLKYRKIKINELTDDWTEILAILGEIVKKGTGSTPQIILFDEISWISSKDDSLIPKLKELWDELSEIKTNVIFVICGSVSTWIEENVLNSTALFGRIKLTITLGELSLLESKRLIEKYGQRFSTYEVFQMLSVTGGVPWYIEQFANRKSFSQNLKELCFQKDGLLVNEYGIIFNDLFKVNSGVYKQITSALSKSSLTQSELSKRINYSNSGVLSKILSNLVEAGYVSTHTTWNLRENRKGEYKLYRLSDNYMRFYLKQIKPNLQKIEQGDFDHITLEGKPGWYSVIGYQVENLLLNQRVVLQRLLEIDRNNIIFDGPVVVKGSHGREGLQIDYLVQTRANMLYFCEFKFNISTVGRDVIAECQRKIKNFKFPRGVAGCPVLFHLGEISDSVYESDYFYKIISLDMVFDA